jgi:hypothetical protein
MIRKMDREITHHTRLCYEYKVEDTSIFVAVGRLMTMMTIMMEHIRIDTLLRYLAIHVFQYMI